MNKYIYIYIYIYTYIFICTGLNTSEAFVKDNQISLNILTKIKLGGN